MIDIDPKALEELHAYKEARNALKRQVALRLNQDQIAAFELTKFSIGRKAKQTHKKLLKDILTAFSSNSDLMILGNAGRHWTFVGSNKDSILQTFKSCMTTLTSAESVYHIEEFNPEKRNYYVSVNTYYMRALPLFDTDDGWYITGKKLKTATEKINAAWNLGYLVNRKRTIGLVRPGEANTADVRMLDRLHNHYVTDIKKQGGYTLRNDLRHTLNRFHKNYNWPGANPSPKF